MRIWHKDLLGVLPRQQLIGQWRELSAIARNIHNNGTPNHILVNKILNYPFEHFASFAFYVREEMIKRGYACSDSVFDSIKSVSKSNTIISKDDLFVGWHDDRYLHICLRNLEEKGMCDGIPANEWKLVYDKYKTKYDLWTK